MKQIEMLQKQRDSIEAQQYSYKPEICHKSRIIAYQQGRRSGSQAEQELLKYGEQVKAKIEQLRSELYHKELNECLFQPKLIAKKKQEPYNDAGGDDDINQPRFSTLYEDAKKR